MYKAANLDSKKLENFYGTLNSGKYPITFIFLLDFMDVL